MERAGLQSSGVSLCRCFAKTHVLSTLPYQRSLNARKNPGSKATGHSQASILKTLKRLPSKLKK